MLNYDFHYYNKKRTYDALKEVEQFYFENIEKYMILNLSEFHQNIQYPSLKVKILNEFPELTILISSDYSELLIIRNNYDSLKSNRLLKKFFRNKNKK